LVPWVGIDVAKASVAVAVRPSGQTWEEASDPSGLATGGYEAAVVAALAAAQLPVVVVNPRQVRDFARAVGRLAKTDRLDAAVLAHCAQAVQPTPRALPDAATTELQALIERRRQLVALRTAEN
jgi:transposase